MKEIIALRTKNSKTYDLGGGRRRVVVDPTFEPPAKDTYLREDGPNANYGTDGAMWLRDWASYIERLILEFDISGLPAGQILTSAKLQLYYWKYNGVDPVGKTAWVYKLTQTDWVEAQATWNIYKTGSNWTTPGGDYVTSSPSGGSTIFPASSDWMYWDVLAIVQDAYGKTIPAEFLVKFADETYTEETSSESAFRTKEYTTALQPKLVIEYELAKPDAPSNLTATTISTTQIDLTWTRGDGADNTVIRRKVDSAPTSVTDGVEVYNGPGTSHNDTTCSPGVHYYYSAWSYNTVSGYSDSYDTADSSTVVAPSITTTAATLIGDVNATLNSEVDDDGGEPCQVRFQYGTTIAYGTDTTWQTGKVTGNTPSQRITGLTQLTTYHFRAQIKNSAGTVNGVDETFTTEIFPTPFLRRVLRDVFGGGADINAANPLRVYDPKVFESLVVYEGTATADGPDTSTITDTVLAGKPDFNGQLVVITSGSYKGQTRDIDQATNIAGGQVHAAKAFDGTIVSGVTYKILSIRPTTAEVADIETKCDAIKTQTDKLAGEAPVESSVSKNWNTAVDSPDGTGGSLVDLGTAATRKKLHSLLLDVSALTDGAIIHVKLFIKINDTQQKVYDETFTIATDPDGLWIVNGTVGIHDVLSVAVYSDNSEDVAIGYTAMLEAM